MSALVISAFPGCGKSVFYNKYSIYAGEGSSETLKVLDIDSSLFSLIYNEHGKTNDRNPAFPDNYIHHIKRRLSDNDIIFVSYHKQVREALHKNNIPFITIYPKDTLDNMKEWKRRFLDRGNNLAFVNYQMEHWTEFIQEMRSSTLTPYKVALDVNGNFSYITEELINKIKEKIDVHKDN